MFFSLLFYDKFLGYKSVGGENSHLVDAFGQSADVNPFGSLIHDADTRHIEYHHVVHLVVADHLNLSAGGVGRETETGLPAGTVDAVGGADRGGGRPSAAFAPVADSSYAEMVAS